MRYPRKISGLLLLIWGLTWAVLHGESVAGPSKDPVLNEISASLLTAKSAGATNDTFYRTWVRSSQQLELTKDALTAAFDIRTKAFAGDPHQQLQMAFGCLNLGRTKEYYEWLEKAVAASDIESIKWLASDLEDRSKSENDVARGFQLSLKAAQMGDIESEEAVAYMYENGEGVAENSLESAKWFSRAAEHGSPSAQWALAGIYLRGGTSYAGDPLPGYDKNESRALELLKLSATGDYATAQKSLGEFYLRGAHGLSVNASKAVDLLRQAADHGDGDAQFTLGQCLMTGDGVLRDYVEAYKWLNLAHVSHRTLRQKAASEFLEKLEAKMTPSQIEEAQRLSKNYRIKPTKLDLKSRQQFDAETNDFAAVVQKIAVVGPAATIAFELAKN